MLMWCVDRYDPLHQHLGRDLAFDQQKNVSWWNFILSWSFFHCDQGHVFSTSPHLVTVLLYLEGGIQVKSSQNRNITPSLSQSVLFFIFLIIIFFLFVPPWSHYPLLISPLRWYHYANTFISVSLILVWLSGVWISSISVSSPPFTKSTQGGWRRGWWWRGYVIHLTSFWAKMMKWRRRFLKVCVRNGK